MRAEEKLTKAQKRKTLRYFPDCPAELLTEEQWLCLWEIVEPQIKKRERDWYGRNVAYAKRVRAQYSIYMAPHYSDVAKQVDFCRTQNVKRKAMSERLGIELPMEYPNPVIDGFNRAKANLLAEHYEMWARLRRKWLNRAEGRLMNRAEGILTKGSQEVCID